MSKKGRLERFSKEVFRVYDLKERLVGFTSLLTNGKWIITDLHDRKLSDEMFGSHKDAFKAFPFDAAGDVVY